MSRMNCWAFSFSGKRVQLPAGRRHRLFQWHAIATLPFSSVRSSRQELPKCGRVACADGLPANAARQELAPMPRGRALGPSDGCAWPSQPRRRSAPAIDKCGASGAHFNHYISLASAVGCSACPMRSPRCGANAQVTSMRRGYPGAARFRLPDEFRIWLAEGF